MLRKACFVLATAAVLATSAAAQPVAEGGEFQVNTYTTFVQDYPDVAVHSDGSFVVVWQSAGSFGNDTSVLSIQGQRYAADGTTLGGEFQVNTYTSSNQFWPVIGQQSDGAFIVVWSSFGSLGNDSDAASVQARRYGADGIALGVEFQVNTITTSYQRFAEVGVGPDDSFIVTWINQATGDADIAAQRFASDGTPLGSEFVVNTYTTNNQGFNSVITMSNGDFVVIYESYGSSTGDLGGYSIQGQRFGSDGSPLGNEFRVNSIIQNDQRRPSAATLANGEFVVAWESDPGGGGPDTIADGVRGRRFASDGTALGGDFQVNGYTFGNQKRPSVTAAGQSEFVVTWESDGLQGTSPSPTCIQVRRFDSGGAPLGADLLVNTYTTDTQAAARIAAAGDSFVVTWTSEGSGGTDSSFTSNQGQRYRSVCSESLPLVADQWTLISLPCDVGASDTVADVFGDDLLPGDYGNRWGVFARDEVNQQYDLLGIGDALEEGVGYWFKTLDAGQTIDVDGVSNPVIAAPLVGVGSGRQNMQGHPVPYDVCWADVQVVDGASVLTLAQADPLVGVERACSMMPADASCVMSRIAYKWNGSAYASFDGETPGAEGTLGAFDGLWAKAFKAGIALRVPALESSSCAGGGSLAGPSLDGLLADGGGPDAMGDDDFTKRSRETEDWFVRLSAEAAGLADPSAVFGQLATSVDAYDRHDLPKLAPFGADYLMVVFPQPDWGARAGDYATDFHRATGRGRRDAWDFEVVAPVAGLEVTLHWQAPSRALQGALLVDLETGERIRPKRDGSYTFQMQGPRHAFRWQLPGGPRSGR